MDNCTLLYRGRHVSAKEFRLAAELRRAAGNSAAADAALDMKPSEWDAWWNANVAASLVGGLASPLHICETPLTDASREWGGPYAAAVWKSQEQIKADAAKEQFKHFAYMLAECGYCLVAPAPPKPRRKTRTTHGRRKRARSPARRRQVPKKRA